MALTDAVTDFIDRDAERRLSGAEEGDYRYADYPYLPANRALASVSELRAVRGMTEPVYQALAPLLTVWPETNGRLNILTCPLPVLRSLNGDDQLSPLDEIAAQRLHELRREGEIGTVADLLADPRFEGQSMGQLEPLLDIRSDWFLLDATVELVERERHCSVCCTACPIALLLFFGQRASYDAVTVSSYLLTGVANPSLMNPENLNVVRWQQGQGFCCDLVTRPSLWVPAR